MLRLLLYKRHSSTAAAGRCAVLHSKKLGYAQRKDFEEDSYYGKLKELKVQKVSRGTEQLDTKREEEFKHLVLTKVFNKVKFISKNDEYLDIGGPVHNSSLKLLKMNKKKGVDIEPF